MLAWAPCGMICDGTLRDRPTFQRAMDTSLAERIDRLEQIEALKQLKYRYCAAVDANYDAAAIAAMFTEDGVWDGADLGCYSGRDAITRVSWSRTRLSSGCDTPS